MSTAPFHEHFGDISGFKGVTSATGVAWPFAYASGYGDAGTVEFDGEAVSGRWSPADARAVVDALHAAVHAAADAAERLVVERQDADAAWMRAAISGSCDEWDK